MAGAVFLVLSLEQEDAPDSPSMLILRNYCYFNFLQKTKFGN